MPPRLLLIPLFLPTIFGTLVSPELVLESGYHVSTVLDFNKPLSFGGIDGSAVRPFSLLPLTHSSNKMLLLDSTHSSFYSIELPFSQESVVRLLSGNGTAGFSDGDPTSTMFNRPQSFAVDSNDNVYVADRINHVIRKISSSSGLTSTIAGGHSRKTGHTDGPAQNATFSENFDLLYMQKMCILLISDRGNGVIRQMGLKPDDCEGKPQPRLGAIPVSIIAVVALLCGLAFGFIARPFVTSRSSDASMNHWSLYLQKLFQSIRKKPLILMFCSGIRSVVASSKTLHLLLYRLVYSSLCFMHVVSRNFSLEELIHGKEHALLLNADFISTQKLNQLSNERNDLLDFEEEISVLDSSSSLANEHAKMENYASVLNLQETEDEGSLNSKIDSMMVSNLFDFTSQSKQHYFVKRRNGVHDLSY